ncbi:MAG: hypothetical protein NWF08_07145 [Candidatus Bathyarchaeota archaeon]|nr:hypothetical protein [Candidatus Bathyarchaeota archaeon]
MDEKAVMGIILLVIGLFGLTLYFPIYSPSSYGGWGCPMMGQQGSWGMMRPGSSAYSGTYYSNLGSIFIFDAIFITILLLGIYLIWKSTQDVK